MSCASVNVWWSVRQPTAWSTKGLGVGSAVRISSRQTQITCHVYPLAVALANTARITICLVEALGAVAMFDSDTGKSQNRAKGKSSQLATYR